MRINKLVLIVSFTTLLGLESFAQDFHYTQYFMTPLVVNPAKAGDYNGTYRLNGVYRDQYRGSNYKPFSGYSINIDAPIIRGIRKQDWVGVGLRLNNDKAGALGQKFTYYGLNVAYHLGLNKKQTQVFSIGAQYGTGGISYDVAGDEAFASQIDPSVELSNEAQQFMNPTGGGNNPSITGGSLNDLSVGFQFNSRIAKSGNDLKLGLAVEGILGPKRGKSGADRKGIGINLNASYHNVMDKRTSLTTGLYGYTLDGAMAVILNSIVNYKLKPGKELMLHGGLGTRTLNSALIYLGATYKGIRFGVGYDLDLASSTTATNYHKSIELGVSYTGFIYKKPKPKPIIYCPRL